MATYRDNLPQLRGDLFITDGGMETTFLFHEGMELPEFAVFPVLDRPGGGDAIRRWYRTYTAIAGRFHVGIILESVTWRASSDWGARLGYTKSMLADVNRRSIELLEEIRSEVEQCAGPIVISGCIGPRGDAYQAGASMSDREAECYHREQIDVLARTNADMICAMTLTNVEEAIGIARAAERAGMPVALSFTVETNGRLPTGEPLKSAIDRVDAATCFYAQYFMVNCAHPLHFRHVFDVREPWMDRIRGVRANSSMRSHAELDNSTELDAGNPTALAEQCSELKRLLPSLNIVGGCCGTDHRHIEEIARVCSTERARRGQIDRQLRRRSLSHGVITPPVCGLVVCGRRRCGGRRGSGLCG